MNVTRLNTHFATFGVDDTGTIGADEAGLGLGLEDIGDADHV